MQHPLFICLYMALLPLSLVCQEMWKPYSFSNDTLDFSFEMPSIEIQTQSNSNMTYWIADSNDETFFCGLKKRRCSTGSAPLKICDMVPFITLFIPNRPQMQSLHSLGSHLWEGVFTDRDNFIYFFHFYAQDDTLFALMTKTRERETSHHTKFIQSFNVDKRR